MSEVIKIDARGQMCPRPVVEVAKARRQAAAGDVIEIRADDLAFESDMKAWCDTTGNRLIELVDDGDWLLARIRVESNRSDIHHVPGS
jgi:TusA-related sulfurtransferase